jgi:uncharacterized protein (TIGR02680 family)
VSTLASVPAAGHVDRWRPARAGLIALWRYWDETFTFHNGRMLLRGPNGSGKSMALELLLPFLLDGDGSPSRLTSSGRSRGRLLDRLMTGTDEPSRTGFAWVEFRRGAEVFTVGARIRGSRATDKTDVDLFTTTQAVGHDLHLLDAGRAPLSRKALNEAIGDHGRVRTTVAEHRTAVREVLFPGFGAERYSSLIGALLALRREKLSDKLDPDKLSEVLSEALPPLDDQDLATVAEGFERLDRRRDELAALERDVAEVRQLARRQRAYAQAVTVAAADGVRSAETTRDDVTRRERQAREELAKAEQQQAESGDERARLEARHDQIDVEVAALKDSDAYRSGAALTDLRSHAAKLREAANEAAETAAARADEHAEAAGEADDATTAHQVASQNEARASDEVRAAATNLGAEQVVAEAGAVDDPDDAERLVRAWVGAQRSRAEEVRSALQAHERAVTQRDVRDEQVSAAELTVEQRRAAHQVAEAAEAAARTQYNAAVELWAGGCETIGAARVVAALPVPTDDPVTVEAAVATLRSALDSEQALARHVLDGNQRAARDDQAALRAERARWESSELVAPEAPPWRSDRRSRPGAPLWQLVEVTAGVAEHDLDAIEAALTASGLLDAWITPDGVCDLGPEHADVQLTARPVPGRTLRDLLAPVPDAPSHGVPITVVADVLSSMSLVETALADAPPVAVAIDGSYRLGNAVGRGPTRPGTLLGAAARERHRLARLAEINAAIAEVEQRLAALGREERALDQRSTARAAELAACPPGTEVVDAVRAFTEAAARLAEARDALEVSRAARREAEDAVRHALRQLTVLASRHGLPADSAGLAAVLEALAGFADRAGTWFRRRHETRTAHRRLAAATRALARAAKQTAKTAARRDQADRQASEVEHRVRTLESSVGTEYAQTLARISALGTERSTNRSRVKELAGAIEQLLRDVGELQGDVTRAAERRAEADADREGAHRRFVAALTMLGADAEVSADTSLDTASSVLASARDVAARHDAVDTSPAAIERRSEQVRERLHQAQAALGARVDFDRELTDDGWWVLRTTTGALRRPVGELAGVLERQLADGRAELAADEERLFEQTLAGSVRRALADRIRRANALVDGINSQLDAIRTAAAGVQVRLRWEVDSDQPAAVKAARELLLRDPADLSEQERQSLQDFVRARVDQARAELDTTAPWEARLRESLDYRSWHRFRLQVAHRDWEGYLPATPRVLQKLSTGERSMALHLPMIASVAAHYADGDGKPSGCPRLILLDELFAGVDAANRAQLFGTFTAWQLDAVFTSDHEWCQYADLDGIAIHYLHPSADGEPVTSTRFTWDGRRRMIDPPAA